MWAMFLLTTFFFVLVHDGEATTIDRKFFHIAMCLVYFPAVLNDINLIFLCSTVVLYVLIIFEVMCFELFILEA